MLKNAWINMGLLVCLTALGCGEDSDVTTDDELAAQSDDLKRPGKKPPKPDDAAAPESPCALVDCRDGFVCEEEEVQCVRAPCPPIASCVPVGPRPDDAGVGASCAATSCPVGSDCIEGPNGAECVAAGNGASCAATLCLVGTICVEGPSGASCVEPSGASCAATLCPTGTDCVEGTGGASCVPRLSCATVLCAPDTRCVEGRRGPQCVPACTAECSTGQHCELIDVTCVRAPCPPQPSCVPDVDACATVRCKAGTHCEVQDVQCVAAPCDPIVQCVSDR